ncbi:unnamed protein product [Brugia pahangi]|uniref:Uncharacterized protein n=1 Tax=Brugia pahangi TaxID=6280 RepID=A0A0N4TU49_BRUPA|nr:unnamed protein product [Brugia pahangi]
MSTWERSAEACRNAPDMMLTCLSYPIYQTLVTFKSSLVFVFGDEALSDFHHFSRLASKNDRVLAGYYESFFAARTVCVTTHQILC